jgi:hypothetical protein
VKRIVVGLSAVVASLMAFVTPSFAMGSSDAFENFQVGVTYTVYEPTYTAGLKVKHIGGNDLCPAGTEENLYATYGKKSGKYFDITEGNPMCVDMGVGPVLLTTKFNGATLTMQAYCDPESKRKCTIADVKRFGGKVRVQMPGVAGLRPTTVWIETFGAKNNLSGAQLVRVAKGLIPVG